jgi:hypothetical protein
LSSTEEDTVCRGISSSNSVSCITRKSKLQINRLQSYDSSARLMKDSRDGGWRAPGAHPIFFQSNQAPQSPLIRLPVCVHKRIASLRQQPPCNARSARLDPTRTRRIASCRQTPSHYSRRALAVEAGGTTRRIPAASECCQGKAGLRRWHGGHAAAVAGNRGADGGVWGWQ